MTLLATVANVAWCTSCLPAYLSFRAALANPRRAQLQILRGYVQRNAATAFGVNHRFDAISGLDDFRRRVPIRGYDEIAPWIDRIAAGGQGVLTSDRVTRLIPSSGSTRAAKLIPYTAGLQSEFNRALGPWIFSLYREMPGLMRGSAYWSITPVAQAPAHRTSQVPIGFDDDSDYLGGFRKGLVGAVMAVPGTVKHLEDMDQFRFETLYHLIGRRDLRLISIWHPSFLELLLNGARDRWDGLVERLDRTDRARASELRRVGCNDWCAIWPNLKLVSCWADANAIGPAEALRRRLPHVVMQPKGLLATEAFISIPFGDHWPLAVRSHFMEFEDDSGSLLLADQLRDGGEYRAVITTAGGLWRYRLGDRVRCDGHVGRTASIRFVGRDDLVVDLFGEKLSEGFVGRTIHDLLRATTIESDFAMLAPDPSDAATSYTLFLSTSTAHIEALIASLDGAQRINPHYAYCRDLGQLARPRVFRIARDAYATFVATLVQSGRRLGEIKCPALDTRTDWSTRFAGAYVADTPSLSR